MTHPELPPTGAIRFVPVPVVSRLPAPEDSVARLVGVFLSGRNALTTQAYRRDLEGFVAFVGAPSIGEAAAALLAGGHGPANARALEWRTQLVERGLAPATVNRHLAALRSLVRLARVLGIVPWTLDVPRIPGRAYRDTRGPGTDGVRRILAELGARQDAKGLRDVALVQLMAVLGLRASEVLGLDLADVEPGAGVVWILGKRRTEKERRTVPPATAALVLAWLEARGPEPGPLFVNLDRARKGRRLTRGSLWRICRAHGAHPHGFRHAAITAALEVTDGDVRKVQQFSRHADPKTLLVYDDDRRDAAGEVAALVERQL